ncbi:MAG: anti-sigma regulatory factor [Rhodothermales bacterium]
MENKTIRYRIEKEGDIIQAVVRARRLSEEHGFRVVVANMIATSVSELARNILKYADSGEIRLRVVAKGMRRGIEVVAEDRGPGISNPDEALKDHFSSSGTLGLGLSGVKRMMDEFQLESAPQQGTRVTVRKWL